jgi:hypothetical protein
MLNIKKLYPVAPRNPTEIISSHPLMLRLHISKIQTMTMLNYFVYMHVRPKGATNKTISCGSNVKNTN